MTFFSRMTNKRLSKTSELTRVIAKKILQSYHIVTSPLKHREERKQIPLDTSHYSDQQPTFIEPVFRVFISRILSDSQKKCFGHRRVSSFFEKFMHIFLAAVLVGSRMQIEEFLNNHEEILGKSRWYNQSQKKKVTEEDGFRENAATGNQSSIPTFTALECFDVYSFSALLESLRPKSKQLIRNGHSPPARRFRQT